MRKSYNISNLALRLKNLRDVMHLDQTAFGEVFGVAVRGKAYTYDYISMLETGKKDVPEKFEKYLVQFEYKYEIKLEPKVENSNLSAILKEPQTEYGQATKAEACHKYLQEFLDSCQDSPDKISWTLIELREKFPLDKWKK